MGWFSKAIPERKWCDASGALAKELKSMAGSWYPTFRGGAGERGVSLKSAEIGETAKLSIRMLQLSAVAATLQKNAYVSDASFFLELVYIMLTGNEPAVFHQDIERLPFARAGDAPKSMTLWARSTASQFSSTPDNPQLLEELARYRTLLVIQAKIPTCEACGDHKGAGNTKVLPC